MLRDVLQVIFRRTTGRTDRGRTTTTGRTTGRTDGQRTTTGHDDDDGQMSKTFVEPCYHIEFNTTNPKPIFKITTCFTK